MSAPHASHQPSVGTTSSAPNTDGDTTGPWSYNDMVRTVTHEGLSCDLCAAWAQHYLAAAFCKDRSLREAEVQRSAAVNALLLAENATRRDNNVTESLRTELDATHTDMALLREEFDAIRRKLSSADAEIFRLRDFNDETIRALKDQIRDLERGHTPRRRKVPRHHSRSQSPSASRSRRQASRPDSPKLEDRDDSRPPSSAARPSLLVRTDLPADTSPTQSPVDPSPPTGGDLASHLVDAVSLELPAPDPAPARAREARWLGFDVDAKAHRVFSPGPGTVSVERNVNFGTSAQFEGEGTIIPISRGEQPDDSNTPTTTPPELPSPTSPLTPLSSASPPESPLAPPPSQLPPLRRSTRTRKPSRLVRDLQSGEGVGMKLPGSFAEEPDEAGGAWPVVDGITELLEGFEGLEHTFAPDTMALRP